jgi:hypothetical protein
MTRSTDTHHLAFDVPENSATSLTIEPNDAGGPPVLIFVGEDGGVDVFNWRTQQYQPVAWVHIE